MRISVCPQLRQLGLCIGECTYVCNMFVLPTLTQRLLNRKNKNRSLIDRSVSSTPVKTAMNVIIFKESLRFAVINGDDLSLKAMLDDPDSPADPNASDADGLTLLHLAAARGHATCAKLLVERGADVNAQAKQTGWFPLGIAAYHGYVDCMEALLDAGGDRCGERNFLS